MAKKHNRSTSQPAPAGARQAIDHFALAEALFSGTEISDVIAGFVAQGFAERQIQYELERAQKSAWFHVAARYAGRAAKRDWVLDFPKRLGCPSQAPIVPHVDKISSADFFEQYYRANRPVVLTGLADGWSAFEKWSLDHLEHLLGDRIIGVQWNREANPNYEADCYDHRNEVPLREVIARLHAGASNDFYITANNSDINKTALAPLWDDVGTIPGILAPEHERDGYFWMGPRGTVTPWHHDLSNNLLLQIKGRKRIRLVAAQDTPLMRNHNHCFTRWNAEDLLPGPGDDTRPAVYEAVIEPGAALFIPVGWWHYVEGLDITMSMTFLNFAAPNDFESNYFSFGDL